jgi:hypothetical protein
MSAVPLKSSNGMEIGKDLLELQWTPDAHY